MARINHTVPAIAITEAINKLQNFELGSMLQKNAVFMDYLQNGIEVKFYYQGKQHNDIVYLIDHENISNNSFIVVNQWTVIEHSEKRPDILIFINGLPVVVFELKSPRDSL